MQTLSDRIDQANSLLAPYAVPHGTSLGRENPEEEDATRFPFQRDRDRIIHTQAFRRLKHKTQVFVVGKGDHYRTRLTHTMEVAQISRDMARTLGLNEDLAECIALAHDLGHPPFGHAGEEALRQEMERHGSTFEHNLQSLRVVTLLEERTKIHSGLNLNREVLEGIMKHRTIFDRQSDDALKRSPSLEAQIVNLADEIAYTAHDSDDGLRAELFTVEDLLRVPLFAEAALLCSKKQTEVRGNLIHLLVMDAYSETERRLQAEHVQTLSDIYASKEEIVAFGSDVQSKLAELRAFLWDHLYCAPAVREHAAKGQEILHEIFAAYEKTPPEKVHALQKKMGSTLPEAIKDYIAGMTDQFALERATSTGAR